MRAPASLLGRLLREPLVQFLLVGAALFVLYRAVSPAPEAPPNRIGVDAAQVARLAQQFQRTWLRPPTRTELAGLVEDHVKEEILYREALALGLEKNDLVIRRRLRQKMEFLNEDIAAQRAPAQAELQKFLDANREKYAAPARVSFAQVYLKADAGRDAARAKSAELLEKLEAGAVAPGEAGDATLLPATLENASAREVARAFGEPFVAALEKIPADGTWHGPIETDYGLHLLRVSARDPGGPLPLEAVRAAVQRDWEAARRAEAQAAFYAALRKRYAVSVEMPPADKAAALKK